MRKVLVGAPQLHPADIKKCNESLRLLNSFLSEADYLVGDEITMVDYSAAASIAGCQVRTGVCVSDFVQYSIRAVRYLERVCV